MKGGASFLSRLNSIQGETYHSKFLCAVRLPPSAFRRPPSAFRRPPSGVRDILSGANLWNREAYDHDIWWVGVVWAEVVHCAIWIQNTHIKYLICIIYVKIVFLFCPELISETVGPRIMIFGEWVGLGLKLCTVYFELKICILSV